VNPGVRRASFSRSASGPSFLPRACTFRISTLPCRSGALQEAI
jgi:hypothetical protein